MNDIETNQAVIDAYDEASYEKARLATVRDHPETITVGEGVTMRTGMGGLYVPYTVIAVKRNGRELIIQRDKTIIDGPNSFADEAPRHYERDPRGPVRTITKRKDGTYIEKGHEKT